MLLLVAGLLVLDASTAIGAGTVVVPWPLRLGAGVLVGGLLGAALGAIFDDAYGYTVPAAIFVAVLALLMRSPQPHDSHVEQVSKARKEDDVVTLLAVASDQRAPPSARVVAIAAAALLDRARVLDLGRSLLDDESEDVRAGVARAAAGSDAATPEALGLLECLAGDQSAAVRSWSVHGLNRLVWQDDPAQLRRVLGDRSWRVRAVAVKALAERGGPEAAAVLEEHVRHERPLRRWGAWKAFRRARRGGH